ncbi:hypothetical protein G3I44_16245 [Halogeometricum borinquense]|uniref:Outer membrane lipoprotein-sorting protein n=1 Tax=Halogeometricum borinquense TaxID=60847 RepID=A0A6C0UKC4_9EURY|nr:hypothetical protein [Halogeometricum borinquense]QIB75697.1 hypothetical protein G3I44_16245 [Halogeometricum borinquense]
MSLQRTGIFGIVLLLALSGCLGGGILSDGKQSPGTAIPVDTPTSVPTSEQSPTDTAVKGTSTMGEIPTPDEQTTKTLDKIRQMQDGIESYQATVTETTVTQLSNGSTLNLVQKWRVWIRYTDDGVLTRVESWSPDSPNETEIYIRNQTASTTYVPEQNKYFIDKSEGTTDDDSFNHVYPHLRSRGGEYHLYESPSDVIRKENAIQYNGTEQIDGQKVYVIHLDGNPNGGHLAYYDAQTIWVDADSGIVLKHTAQKPHLDSMANMTVRELRNPDESTPWNTSDNRPNAVYLGDKTITTTYTNVSVNNVSSDVFTPDFPKDVDIENATKRRS